MEKENHPYINLFNPNENWEYLIIGTFPPNKKIRESKKSITDYFYGNKGSLWKIIGGIYTDYNFEKGSREEILKQIRDWQNKYRVGITDTLKSVSRKNIKSPDDSDLIIDSEDYNYDLKSYILKNKTHLKTIILTSSKGKNSAYNTFKFLMGSDFNSISDKVNSGLPSPSGSSNLSWFNVNNEETMGLHPDFHLFIKSQKNDLIPFFKKRWLIKKQIKETKLNQVVPKSPEGLISEFKIWRYGEVLPKP